MAHYKLEFLDLLEIIAKRKKELISVFFLSLFLSYGIVYFFVEKQYDAKATIIPMGQNSLAGISSLMKNISSVLPIGLGKINQESETDLYNILIYSRTFVEHLNDQFKLQTLYKIKKRDDLHKVIRKMIKTEVTMENAFSIRVRTKNPHLASDIANYIVKYLNIKIIELNVSKSKENRKFLEKRYYEIRSNLEKSEDTLRDFQGRMGIFNVSEQARSTIESFAKLESELAVKQIEYQVVSRIYGYSSPNASNAKIAISEYEKKLKKMKVGQDKSISIVGIDSLPEKALLYYRLYREVKINEEMLHFILPLYEQSKFEEQKDIPILQVIDPAIPPEKKSYPPRLLIAGLLACLSTFTLYSFFIVHGIFVQSNNPKIIYIRRELFRFK